MTLLNESLSSALHEQWSQERFNSHVYLYIAGYLKNMGLDNIAKLFLNQHDEEISHSKQIFDFLTDTNSEIKILEVPAVSVDCSTIGNIAKEYLQREIATTDSLNSIKLLAIEQNEPLTEEFMRTMLSQQVKEIEEANGFMDKSKILSEWWMVSLWDLSLK